MEKITLSKAKLKEFHKLYIEHTQGVLLNSGTEAFQDSRVQCAHNGSAKDCTKCPVKRVVAKLADEHLTSEVESRTPCLRAFKLLEKWYIL
jgi:hypothetical protein